MGTILKIKAGSLTPDGPTQHVLRKSQERAPDTVEIMLQITRENVRRNVLLLTSEIALHSKFDGGFLFAIRLNCKNVKNFYQLRFPYFVLDRLAEFDKSQSSMTEGY